MANGRVQVQGVGSAPKLQAVVNAGGQYRVQTQQAGRNKLMDLADALSQVNPILRDYGAIQDIDAEMYEDDLKRLSPEDLKKKLSQSEATLDREVRKGNIPFLGSPLNWKRKKRALGKAAHDVFYNQLIAADGRLRNPIEGDDDKNTADIVNEEMAKFIENNPGLQGQFQNEGFQEVLNPTITRLAAQFDGEKARQARVEIGVQTVNEFVREAKNVNHLDSAQYDLDMERLKDTWQDMNGFAPTQQRAAISSVVKSLARVDELKARAFLNWAKTNIKVGNTLYGKHEAHAIELEQLIDDVAEQEEKESRIERAERLEATESEFILALNAIQNTGEAEYNGQMYNDVNVLLKGFQETVAGDADPIYAAQAQKNAESAVKGDVDVDEYARRELLQESMSYREMFGSIKRKLLGNIVDDKTLQADSRFDDLNFSLAQDLKAKVEDKIKRLIRQGKAQNPIEAAGALDEFINNELELLGPTVKDSIEKLKTRVKEEEDADAEARRVTATTPDTEAVTASIWGDDPEDVVKNVQQNRSVLSNKATPDEERKKALNYIRKNIDPTLSHFARIAAPNSRRERRVGGANRLIGYVEYTPKQRKEATENYFELARLSGVFALPNALKDGVTRDGFKFDPKKIEPTSTVLLTVPQVNSVANISDPAKVPADIKNVIRLIGYKGDALTFVRKQRELHVFLNNIK